MLIAVHNCDMKEPLIDPKIVSLASYKQRVLQDQDVKMLDYAPTEQDVISFLRVLRFLQKKTLSEQVEIDSNADGITIALTEFKSDDDDPDASTVEYTTISHKTFVPFPFMLVDIDPSELTVHEGGKNTVELFAESAATMMTRLNVGGK